MHGFNIKYVIGDIKFYPNQSNLKIDFTNLTLEQQQFVVAFTYSYLNLFESFDNDVTAFQNYSPPLVEKDLNVLYRVFRI